MLQRDLGTTLIICGSVLLVLFAAGVRFRYLFVTSLGGLAAIAYFIFGTAYRRTRFLEAWLNWELDPSGAGWQLRQGLIALGSGGWLGVGLGNSRQKWDYLPNAHSDFVFAVLGEELGLIGALAVLSLFGLLLYAGIRIAVHASDPFGRLLAAGITGWIGLQTLVNLGAVTGLLPITGVPLPFLSFGGTALVVTLAGIGVMASVALDETRSERRAERRAIRPCPARSVAREGRDRRRRIGGPRVARDRGRGPAAGGGASVEFVGSPTGQEATIVPANGYRFHGVPSAPFRRELSARSIAAPFVTARAVRTCRPIVRGRRGARDGRLRQHRPGRRGAYREGSRGGARAERDPRPREPTAGATGRGRRRHVRGLPGPIPRARTDGGHRPPRSARPFATPRTIGRTSPPPRAPSWASSRIGPPCS